MRYSVITPTLCRPTLKRLCESIDFQLNPDWEHIIVVDCELTPVKQAVLDSLKEDSRRKIIQCSVQHPKDFGNTARRQAYDVAQGDYICQIDDDDYYSDPSVFITLEQVTATWAIYPVLARNKRCHVNPPGLGRTGSAMFLYRRDTGIKFPANDHYAADGEVVEELKKKYPYQSLDDERELVIYPWANHGMEQADIDARIQNQRTPLRYAADGCTVDWNDIHKRVKD
jgi:glycosyltransferase involved in cell wall biosynthesis